MWILRDAALWFSLHMLAVYISHKTPITVYAQHQKWFRLRAWEQGGTVYKRWFFIHRWKHRLPDGGQINEHGFAKLRMESSQMPYLEKFLLETMRAETIHWMGLGSLLVFLLLHPFPLNVVLIVLLSGLDIPFIVIQRYNRPRLQRILEMHKRRCQQ